MGATNRDAVRANLADSLLGSDAALPNCARWNFRVS